MKIFLIDDRPKDYGFAECSVVGSWTEGGLCKACQLTPQDLTEPLLVEWEPGSDVIGDFSWSGYNAIVTEKVKSILERNRFECRFGGVQVVPLSEKSKKTKVPRVLFPYNGPSLYWLMPAEIIALDEARSGIKLLVNCPQCGQTKYSFHREGLVIPRTALGKRKMFRIMQFGKTNTTFVTEEGAALLTEAGCSNFHCNEAGEVV